MSVPLCEFEGSSSEPVVAPIGAGGHGLGPPFVHGSVSEPMCGDARRALRQGRPMFTLHHERRHRVLLTRFEGMLVPEDIERHDAAVRRFVQEHGRVRGLADFTGVTTVAVPWSLLAARARQPQLSPGQERVMVAPGEEIHEMLSDFAARQADAGNLKPLIVRTLAEGHAALGLHDPRFEPVGPDGSAAADTAPAGLAAG